MDYCDSGYTEDSNVETCTQDHTYAEDDDAKYINPYVLDARNIVYDDPYPQQPLSHAYTSSAEYGPAEDRVREHETAQDTVNGLPVATFHHHVVPYANLPTEYDRHSSLNPMSAYANESSSSLNDLSEGFSDGITRRQVAKGMFDRKEKERSEEKRSLGRAAQKRHRQRQLDLLNKSRKTIDELATELGYTQARVTYLEDLCRSHGIPFDEWIIPTSQFATSSHNG
ncbi:uncharacterized protein L201_007117 [Kwoniella dendrophila CBS 6074]|uniref:BZIP domain-containing protein n=1 Tax=Kwoniella dendrophila CBS 6074 TaxID=1295534 RepID=A0AAX4K4Y9_9TREE